MGSWMSFFLRLQDRAERVLRYTMRTGDSVKQLLWEKEYDAIVTLMPPRLQNLQSYEFSDKILDLGPILIVPKKSKAKSLDDLDTKRVGFIEGEDSILILAGHPKVLVQSYTSITDLLNAVVSGEVDGALAEIIVASSYVADLYIEKLKTVGQPLSEDALRLAVVKGRNQTLIPFFNKYLSKVKRKSIYKSTLRKWELLP